MVRIDRLLLGYVTVSFGEDIRTEVMNALIGASLSASFTDKAFFDVSLFMLPRYKKALSHLQVSFSEVRGLSGFLFSLRKRYGIISALLLLAVYYLFVSRYVWDVRIEGNREVSQYEIIDELRCAGLYIGANWSTLSQDKVESALLETSDNIGWLNIYRRGSVAYVTVREKNIKSEIADKGGYSNIVAAEDCVIDSVNVVSGVAMVKAGGGHARGKRRHIYGERRRIPL
ncbi:MAG: sporulation protein YqfD [Clostridia bacterium]|nr:sporulation protein YqfD [Clostridia bacterium]